MAKEAAKKHVFDFSKGIITDAPVIGFPAGACVDQENMLLTFDGARRRKGVDYEASYALYSHTISAGDDISVHKWHNVNNDPNTNFVVVKAGSTVFFYDDAGTTLSGNKKSFVVDLTAFPAPSASGTNIAQNPIDTHFGRGHLFIVGRYIEPILVKYNSDDTLTTSALSILERDLEGIEDEHVPQYRPSTLTTPHEYNLLNQGWASARITEFYTGSTNTLYPSNADIWYFGKKKNGSTGLESFDYAQVIIQDFGNAASPRGRFLRNPFNTEQVSLGDVSLTISTWSYSHSGSGTITITTTANHGLTTGDTVSILGNAFIFEQSWTNAEGTETNDVESSLDGEYTITVTGLTTFTFTKRLQNWTGWISQFVAKGSIAGGGVTMPSGYEQETNERFQAVAWFAGRVWYAGVQNDRLGSRLYFSQTVEKDVQYRYCFQQADPTSEHIPDLVDTDGGYLNIGNLGLVYKMIPMGLSLFVFTSSGVWEISGPEDSYFRATGYRIRRLSDNPCIGKFSPVLADTKIFYWTASGIEAIGYDDRARMYTNRNVTEGKLDAFYAAISDLNKSYVVGCYDDVNKRVYWMYGSSASYTFKYDLALILDMRYGAFYKLRIPVSPAYVAGIQMQRVYTDTTTKVKFFTVAPSNKITFSEMKNTSFKDWYTYDTAGVDTSAFIIPGYEIVQDPTTDKYSPLIYVYLKKTETGFSGSPVTYDNPSSCLMQARWNWHITDSGNKWTEAQQVYRFRRSYVPSGSGDTFDDGEQLVVTRNKLRGRGKAIHLKFYSESGKDMYILGWSFEFQGPKVN